MSRIVITEPAIEPLTLDEAKDHLRVDLSDDDAVILSYIKAARKAAENYTERSFITQTLKKSLDCFPALEMELPYGDVQSVESITYIDTNGTQQTLSSSDYQVDTDVTVARVAPAPGKSWPSTLSGQMGAVKVTYKAGYGDSADDVPEDLKSGLKMHVGHLFDHREATTPGVKVEKVPFGMQYLFTPYRIRGFV
ncbi:MAG: head-tail connector protein [Alphaproteobacteria bacterium]|nr:head-tail connector protein [Alphaproteobacteria bacterium]